MATETPTGSLPPEPSLRTRAHEQGEVIDGFRLDSLLHVGGMAEIWSVTHPDLNAPAVMKIPVLGEDPTAIVSFETEHMILPLLAGQHVPRWIAAGSFERHAYVVLERIAGPSLLARLDGLPLPLDEVAKIGTRIAEALHDLHGQGVVHLDIKPSNILFRPDGTAVLIDYGLARHDRLPDLLAEQFHLPMGTGPYMSPEQTLYDRSNLQSDLFSLGVILYYLATGVRPYGTPLNVGALRRRLFELPVPPRQIRAEIPLWLQEIILRCLEVNPAHRYTNAAQLAFDLSHADAVVLTERAHRLNSDGWLKRQLRRANRALFQSWKSQSVLLRAGIQQQRDQAPIILAAVDLTQEWEAQAQALRDTIARILLISPHSRLACVTVFKPSRLLRDVSSGDSVHPHVQRLVQLQHWARPLNLPTRRLSFHVLENTDSAEGILAYAHNNKVAHIVIGSRGASSLRRYLGSVSTTVVAQAQCSVTVVKVAESTSAGLKPTATDTP